MRVQKAPPPRLSPLASLSSPCSLAACSSSLPSLSSGKSPLRLRKNRVSSAGHRQMEGNRPLCSSCTNALFLCSSNGNMTRNPVYRHAEGGMPVFRRVWSTWHSIFTLSFCAVLCSWLLFSLSERRFVEFKGGLLDVLCFGDCIYVISILHVTVQPISRAHEESLDLLRLRPARSLLASRRAEGGERKATLPEKKRQREASQ